MKLEEYPKLTVILRGYSYDESMTIISCLAEYENKVAVEVTTNNPDYLKIIEDARKKFDGQIHVGVGTVLELAQAKDAIKAGAEFMLGPCEFSRDILEFAKNQKVLTVPAAFSSTEVRRMKENGADIIKIFPAKTVTPDYFKQLQAPLGPLPLMAVGGVDVSNAREFLKGGASYLGIGSSMFAQEDVRNQNKIGLKASIERLLQIVEESKE